VEGILKHLRVRNFKGKLDIMIGKDFAPYKTVWTDKRYDASEYGTKLLKMIIPDCEFDYPKSIYTVLECLTAVVRMNKEAIILDFFAGSGTTGHATMLLNREDGGNRQFILCTNNENGIAEEVTYPRIKNVIEGYADVPGIPANVRYFKTAFVPKSPVSDDTRYELVQHSTDMICVREDTFKHLVDEADYKIFRNACHYTAILFNIDALSEFKERLNDLTGEPMHIYVFSLTGDTYESDFADLQQEHVLCPIPESILEVYRRIQERK
jgi:adenine-specific DNA-methyltransferase